MAKKITYKPYSKSEIELYKKQKKQLEDNRDQITNNSLIALRKKHLNTIKPEESLERKIRHFNKYIKSKKIDDIVKVVNYLLSNY